MMPSTTLRLFALSTASGSQMRDTPILTSPLPQALASVPGFGKLLGCQVGVHCARQHNANKTAVSTSVRSSIV